MVPLNLVFQACKKDEAKKPSEILTAVSEWKVTKDEIKLQSETNWTVNTIDACSADQFFTLL